MNKTIFLNKNPIINKATIINTIFVGVLASIIFILIQPLFGMLTLTSRHAAVYVKIGGYSEVLATTLAWLLHISVSIFYSFISLAIFKANHSVLVSFVQVGALGWLTTLTATPANEWVIKFITTGKFTALSALSDLNTDVGSKLWLHILFFALVVSGLWFIQIKANQKRGE